MAGPEQNNPLKTRPPTLADLLMLCRALNEQSARYIVIGGFAIFEHGLARLTEDIDFLIDAAPENVARVKRALECLPDKAVREMAETDVMDYVVVRVNDEITIDLMAAACGVSYAEAVPDIELREVNGVRIPFASVRLLWKTKRGGRAKDVLDRAFLQQWFEDRGEQPPE